MARIYEDVKTASGTRLMIIESSSSGGGKYGWPAILRIAETDGTDWTRVDSPNVLRVIEQRNVDRKHRGPTSNYGRTVAGMRDRLHAMI